MTALIEPTVGGHVVNAIRLYIKRHDVLGNAYIKLHLREWTAQVDASFQIKAILRQWYLIRLNLGPIVGMGKVFIIDIDSAHGERGVVGDTKHCGILEWFALNDD